MNHSVDIRFASHPADFKKYDTKEISAQFLIQDLFIENTIQNVYSHYDRLIVGGAMPKKDISLSAFPELKSSYYLERRELGIINVGAKSKVLVDGNSFELDNKDALYIAKGSKEVIFCPSLEGQALYYFNSAPAHVSFPTKKIAFADAEKVELGSVASSNHRIISKLIVNSILPTCQLQMGLTQLKVGSVWNTLPPHTHTRRMEAYFYFEIPENQVVCHFMGQPDETRHLWIKNNQAVISPPWSIHSGSGTSNYSFIWGMAGENLDYGDMDGIKLNDLQ
jgi:4-deoxy-L-threo-5-hexosulose-uronate ketol-isomerase